MAKVSYVGASDKARRVKKLFVGIDGKARKVKKAYVGVGGVARLFFSSGVQPGLYVLGGYTYTLYRFDVNSMTAVSSVSVGSYLDTGSIQGDISTFPAWELIPCGATDSQAFVTKFTTRVTTFIDPVTGAVVKQVTHATTDPLLSGGAKTRIIGTKGHIGTHLTRIHSQKLLMQKHLVIITTFVVVEDGIILHISRGMKIIVTMVIPTVEITCSVMI